MTWGRTLHCSSAWVALALAPIALAADTYHNIQGFYGGRAASLAGAYAAVSDDPSGAYYNPAGLGFLERDYVTISASNYRNTQKSYENVFGPGQGYVRASESYQPNFLGAFSKGERYTWGFSVVSQSAENFDQGDQLTEPLGLPNVASYRNEYTEDNTRILAGPSLGWKGGGRLAFGGTLYYLYDSTRVTTNQTILFRSGSFRRLSVQDRRRTLGFEPVLGLQYEWLPNLIAGVSLRQTIVTAESRTLSGIDAPAGAASAGAISLSLGTDVRSGSVERGAVILGSPPRGTVPETTEARAGIAWIAGKQTLVSADIVRTSGYRLRQDRTQIDLTNRITYINSDNIAELRREPTTNLALGFEQYLSDRVFLAAGFFTNASNKAERPWLESALAAAGRNFNNGSSFQNGNIVIASRGGFLAYRIPLFADTERFESVDTRGVTLGLGWSDEKSSITLTFTREWGRGSAQIDASQPAAPLAVESRGFMIVAGTRY